MQVSHIQGDWQAVAADALIFGVFDAANEIACAAELSDTLAQAVQTLLNLGDCTGKLGQVASSALPAGSAVRRVVLVGLGTQADWCARQFGEACRAAYKAVAATSATQVVCALPAVADRPAAWVAEQAVVLAYAQQYVFDACKSQKSDAPVWTQLGVYLADAPAPDVDAALQAGQAIGQAMGFTKTLANLPSNYCTPTYLAQQAQALLGNSAWQGLSVQCEVLDEPQMRELGMGSLLSVAKGSVEPPKLIVLQYHGAGAAQPVVLVGKGITFDSGGVSLKPGEGMDEMKYDMCGAATVLGVFKAAVDLRLPVNLTVIVAACENMPAGHASKPGDVVTSMAGTTIEILNTDAEGRLILCDALTYAARFNPACVIDVATLTGACVIALGHITTGVWSNQDDLAHALVAAGQTVQDKAWQMPLFDDYQQQLKSNFADVANIGGRPAGSITAACFLSRFTKAYRWAHLDIAGTAWTSGASKGATGRPVPLLVQFLRDYPAVSA